MSRYKVGDRVMIPVWADESFVGMAEVVKVYDENDYVNIRMLDGPRKESVYALHMSKVIPAKPIETPTPIKEEPLGFGVWIEGKFHPVDVGALGTLISLKDAEIKQLKAQLAEQLKKTPKRRHFGR